LSAREILLKDQLVSVGVSWNTVLRTMARQKMRGVLNTLTFNAGG